MTDKETLKLALDALELVNIEFVCDGAHHAKKDRHGLDEDCPVTMRYRKAIAALKERLAEHAMREVQRLGQEIEQERKWVGLTKQQQLDIFAQSVAKKRSEHEHYMAIEQALKERNQ